jgi:hypothetical protein
VQAKPDTEPVGTTTGPNINIFINDTRYQAPGRS